MPTLFHSRLQRNLLNAINACAIDDEAIQELRCIVPPFSPVPDISVVATHRLPTSDGSLQGAPDWMIEIRSPEQNTLVLQSKILHCLGSGMQLAWLIDLQQQRVWVWQGADLPITLTAMDVLPVLGNIVDLTVAGVIAMTQQRSGTAR